MRWKRVATAVLATWMASHAAAAEEAPERTLTIDAALDLARRRAPDLIAARAAVEEARSRLAILHPRLGDNPSVSLDAGPRWSSDGRTLDLDVAVDQKVEIGGRGAARIAMANADVEQAAAAAEDATRRFLARVAEAFLDVLRARERLREARASEHVVGESARVAERRSAGGDVGPLDANLAAVALARARADTLVVQAQQESALGLLRVLLDLDSAAPLAVRGDLREALRLDLDQLLARAAERPDLKALEAELRRSEAEERLGRASAWPDVGLRVGYGREEQDNIARGGFTLSLPFLDHGQATRGAAVARRTAVAAALDAARRAAAVEVRAAYERYLLLARAAETLEREALPRAQENEDLARRAYELGALPLGELLVAQREAIAARVEHVDLLRDAAVAAFDVRARAGVSP